ncbi:MAG: DUF3341 domain-containing protein [Bryobacteraceae bacterium]
MSNNISVYGIFKNRAHAEAGLHQIRENGFRPEDLSVLLPETLGTKDIGVENSTKSPEGAATGGAAGAVAGGVLGWLVGIGALAIPGVGPFIAAGPIMAALAGMGAGAALGGVTGGLVGIGIPEYEAQRYEGRIKNGGILVSVHCDNSDWASRAKKTLEAAGAEDISSSGEAKADFSVTDKPMTRTTTF